MLCLFSSYCFADQLIIEPDAGRTPLLNAIQQANNSIDVVLYGLTDETLINALINAKNTGKKMTILLEPTPYKSENENNRAIRQLQKANITLKWPDNRFQLLHQKTFIFDKQTAIVMTFNLTHGSFTRERNFALVVTEPLLVKEINQVFAADCLHQKTSVSQAQLVWSPDNSREKILQFIQSAHSDIHMYAQDVTDYQMIGALANAARLGKQVRILLSVSPGKLKSKKLLFLQKAGVIIHNSRHYYIHAKVIIIDHQRALLGSINFTKASLENNRELSVFTEDPNVIQPLNTIFEKDWQN